MKSLSLSKMASRRVICALLSILITFLFLITMLFVYAAFAPLRHNEENSLIGNRYCVRTRKSALLQKVYSDSFDVKFTCLGVILSEQIAVFHSECFSKYTYTRDYYTTSGNSEYWSKERNLHAVKSFEIISSHQGDLALVKIQPSYNTECLIEPVKIEKKLEAPHAYTLIGWDCSSREADKAFEKLPYNQKCYEGKTGVVVSQDGSVFGFHPCSCDTTNPVLPLGPLMPEITAMYPNIVINKCQCATQKSAGSDSTTNITTEISETVSSINSTDNYNTTIEATIIESDSTTNITTEIFETVSSINSTDNYNATIEATIIESDSTTNITTEIFETVSSINSTDNYNTTIEATIIEISSTSTYTTKRKTSRKTTTKSDTVVTESILTSS